ncbi:UPF0149 family protein [Cupriavidus basilensis]|uniref:UPF0149 family protein n=1 Tax=Cupriavidus basilensis TaxID=68895 RepID=UPI0020C63718|nr:UPF0149 family protein [Cupriavidus basilensis]
MAPLSDEELDELDQFLIYDATSDTTLMLAGLDGYLTVTAIGPATLPPSQVLPGIWGPERKMRRISRRRIRHSASLT